MKRIYTIFAGIILLLILLLIAERKINPFGNDNSLIAVPESKAIESIIIISGKEKLTLQKTGKNEWSVNGTGKARSSAINYILSILHRIELKSPVSETAFKEASSESTRPVTKVEVYGRHRKLSSFMVYRPADSTASAIIQKTSGSIPFIACIPGSDIDPCSHFIADPRFWVPYNIFSIPPASISRIDLFRDTDTVPSVSLIAREGKIDAVLEGLSDMRVDTAATGRYITYYTFVPFENWAFEMPAEMKDRLKKRNPWYTIRVREVSGVVSELKLWKRYLDEPSCNIEDTDRLWGSLNNGRDFFIATYYDVDPIIKSPDYFISE